jgi:hypothetical protein
LDSTCVEIGSINCVDNGEGNRFTALLREYFPRPLPHGSLSPSRWTVVHEVDAGQVGAWLRRAASRTSQQFESFPGSFMLRVPLGDGVVVLRELTDEPDTVWVVRGRTVHTYSKSAQGAHQALRAVREIYHRSHEGAGALFMHGAAVAYPGGAAIFSGPKGAGKTTLALAACAGGASYVSNDRVGVHLDEQAWVSTFPMALRVHPGSLIEYPLWAERLGQGVGLSRTQEPNRIVAPTVEQRARVCPSDCKYELTTAEVERVLGLRTCPAERLSVLIIPHLQQDDSPHVRVDPVEPGDASEQFRTQCTSIHEDTWLTPWMQDFRAGYQQSRVLEQLDLLVGAIPTYRLRYAPSGTGLRAASEAVRALIRGEVSV